MNASVKEQLMDKILHRLDADSPNLSSATSQELAKATNQLVQEVQSLNRVLSTLNKTTSTFIKK